MTFSTLKPDASLRKAAVLMRSLDADAVAALLARLSPAEAKAVRLAVRELDEVSEEDRALVAADLRRAASPAGPDAVLAPVHRSPPAASSPLAGLNHAPPEAIASFLKIEQPTTVAVVLSRLAPSRAGEVLGHLPEELQASAVDRLAELGEIDPESLNVIADELHAWITKHAQESRRKQDRRETLAAILQASPPALRRRLAGSLGEEEQHGPLTHLDGPPQPAPVRQPSPAPSRPPAPRLPFSAIESLPAARLVEVIQGVDHQTLVLALLGASGSLMARLRSLATRKQMRQLEQSITRVGPVRLRDIEQAKLRLAESAARVLLGKEAA
ncbi:MAG: hypothetical protein KDA37_15135 [Planctomycetales bacterium]|nr:hypothetical protein [Planctomycetales bacterium]